MDLALIIQIWSMQLPFQVIPQNQIRNMVPAVKKWLLPMLLLQMVELITNHNMSAVLSLAMEPQKISLIKVQPQ